MHDLTTSVSDMLAIGLSLRSSGLQGYNCNKYTRQLNKRDGHTLGAMMGRVESID